MRIEIRIEDDAHEFSVIIETDKSIARASALHVANQSMVDLLGRSVNA